ncbi:hypothetical protein KSP40_PGU008853 [Platanthera guangdongensis]|uniref:Uncharacterized protein n=1 Tax=Platanthera guangdongensis TaxID=2320717 RepID=A0ABR2MIP1_9ASPA
MLKLGVNNSLLILLFPTAAVFAMSPACQSSVGCIDAHVPVHPAANTNLYRWAESDAKFVRSLTPGGGGGDNRQSSTVIDSFSCRQKFLRSYTFSKKETVPEKTVKCLGKAKVRAAALPCFHYQNCGQSLVKPFAMMSGKKYESMKPKKKGQSVLWWIFYRLLSCTSSFDVADVNSAVHAM